MNLFKSGISHALCIIIIIRLLCGGFIRRACGVDGRGGGLMRNLYPSSLA